MFGQWMGDNKFKLKEEKSEPFEIVLPGLYNTPSKPKSEEINNYSVWIPSIECEEEAQICINGKWHIFGVVSIIKDEKKVKEISDKEYNLIKAIREYMEEED